MEITEQNNKNQNFQHIIILWSETGLFIFIISSCCVHHLEQQQQLGVARVLLNMLDVSKH